MSNMRIRNIFLLVTALAVMFLLACGQSDEEIDALVEAKVTEILANMPDPTPIPEPTPITIPTPVPTATPSPPPTPMPTATPMPTPTPWGFNMTGWEAVGLVKQSLFPLKIRSTVGDQLKLNYSELLYVEVPNETEKSFYETKQIAPDTGNPSTAYSKTYYELKDDAFDLVETGSEEMLTLKFVQADYGDSDNIYFKNSNYRLYVYPNRRDIGMEGNPYEISGNSCLDFVELVHGDWKFDYIENMNTWRVEKGVLSWTVYVRTNAVVSHNIVCQSN